MAAKVEFFFDLSSPWTALAFHNIRPIIKQTGAQIFWRPILVGGVFNAVNPSVYAAREQSDNRKLKHGWKVLMDWAAWSGISMNFPSPHHPLKSVLAMRACCVLQDDQDALENFVQAAFNAYFTDQANLDDPAILADIATAAGFDGLAIVAQTQKQDVKDRLRANTEEVIARGGYGSPTIFVNGDDMYFGNDQLPLIKFAIEGK